MIRLPWISREAHEALLAEKDARIAEMKDVAGSWELRTSIVLGELATLREKHEAAMAPKVEAVSPPNLTLAPRKEPDIVLQTIRELAQGDQRMMQYLHKRKRELRAEHPNISDDMICVELSKWETSDSLLDQPSEAQG